VQELVLDLVRKLGGYDDVFGSSYYVSLGMDSFSTLEFISRIEVATGVEISVASLTPEITVNDIIRSICCKVRAHTDTGGRPHPSHERGCPPARPHLSCVLPCVDAGASAAYL
jgi:hypothetical protein